MIIILITFARPKIEASYTDVVNYAEVIIVISDNGYDDFDDNNGYEDLLSGLQVIPVRRDP